MPSPRDRAGVSVQHAAADRGMEPAVSSPGGARSRPDAIRNLESGRLSGRESRPLRRLSFAAQRARRRKNQGSSRGRFAEGWEAAPLTSLSAAPIPWSEGELFAYLRTGISRFHGVAAGPMAPVVQELSKPA